jgi:hypothetical protein
MAKVGRERNIPSTGSSVIPRMNKATPNSTPANPINSLLIFCGAQFKAFIMTSFMGPEAGKYLKVLIIVFLYNIIWHNLKNSSMCPCEMEETVTFFTLVNFSAMQKF